MNESLTFTFTIEQVNLILRHLDQGKHSEVRQLMDLIITEANAQAQAKQGGSAPMPAPTPEAA